MNEITRYLAEIGSQGGKNGTGAKKRRSTEHYQGMARKAAASRKANRLAAAKETA